MSYFSFSKKNLSFIATSSFLAGAGSVLSFFPQEQMYTSLAEKYSNTSFNFSDLDQITSQVWKEVGDDIKYSLVHGREVLNMTPENNQHKS